MDHPGLAEETELSHALDSGVPKSELEFRRLLDKLPAGAYTCDLDGLITYYNPQAVRLWGRKPKLNDPIDRFCGSFKLFSSDGEAIVHEQCWMAMALRLEKEFNGHEIIIERPNGERLTALAHANPIRDEAGRIVGAVNVLVDISDRKRAEEAVKMAERMRSEFLAALAQEILKVSEREQTRLGQDLHDGLGQELAAIGLMAGMHAGRLGKTQSPEAQSAGVLAGMISQAIATTRAFATSLYPVALKCGGLLTALEELGHQTRKRFEVDCTLEFSAPRSDGEQVEDIHIYRIVQEAIRNAVRHGRAKKIVIDYCADAETQVLSITDNGTGIADVEAARLGTGLRIMSYRARLIGGTLDIECPDGGGCRIVCRAVRAES